MASTNTKPRNNLHTDGQGTDNKQKFDLRSEVTLLKINYCSLRSFSPGPGASGACKQLVRNPAIFRLLLVKYPVLLTEDRERGVEDGDLWLNKLDSRKY